MGWAATATVAANIDADAGQAQATAWDQQSRKNNSHDAY